MKDSTMTNQLKIGDLAPSFNLPATSAEEISLANYRGQNLVIFFYPRDNTTGCTAEAKDFSSRKSAFEDANTAILGISRDSIASHNRFKETHSLSVELASDKTGDICESYGVLVEKRMYGKVGIGIERSTFLIDQDGRLTEIWRKVKVAGHADSVLAKVKSS